MKLDEQRPLILVLHPRVNFINPTTGLWPRVFESLGEVSYFGPGRNKQEVLDRGLEHYVSQLPRVPDLLVVSELASNPEGEGGSDGRAKQLAKIYGYSAKTARQFLARKSSWIREAKHLGLPTILTFFEFDPYRVSEAWCDRVQGWDNAVIMGWGVEFVAPIAELSRLHDEVFAQRATDLWHDLLVSNSARVFSQPAFVSDDEFHYKPIATRPKNLSVLGTTYADRRRARQIAKAHSLSVAGELLHPMVAMYDLVSSGRIGNRAFIGASQALFRRSLHTSRVSFTCGSGLEYPLRKMLEIPAAGTVLATRPTRSTQSLGFVPWENFVPSAPEDLPRITDTMLQTRCSDFQALANRGQQLVREKHSLTARVPMVAEVVDLMLRSAFEGSYWQRGEHVVRVRDQSA